MIGAVELDGHAETLWHGLTYSVDDLDDDPGSIAGAAAVRICPRIAPGAEEL